MPEWLKGADCKSADVRLRWFESNPLHQMGEDIMQFGVRKPSLKKSFAARTSLKRYVRHSLGIKAPRGYGWLTNPKRLHIIGYIIVQQ